MTTAEMEARLVAAGKSPGDAARIVAEFVEKQNVPARVKEPAPAVAEVTTAPSSAPRGPSTATRAKPTVTAPAAKVEAPRPVADDVMLGPQRPPVTREEPARPSPGPHVADPFPARGAGPTWPEQVRASTEADIQRRRAEARAAAGTNREVLERYVRAPARRAVDWLEEAPGRALSYVQGAAIDEAISAEIPRAEARGAAVTATRPASPPLPSAADKARQLRAAGLTDDDMQGEDIDKLYEHVFGG